MIRSRVPVCVIDACDWDDKLLVCQRRTSTARPCLVSIYCSMLPKLKDPTCSVLRPSTRNKRCPIRQHLQSPILSRKLQLVIGFRMGLGTPSFPDFLFHPSVQSSLSAYNVVIQTVRLYDIAANEEKTKFDHRAAVLSTTFSDASHAYSGGLDASLREYGCPSHC